MHPLECLMAVPTNGELVERWRDEPAPLLPLLHAFHDRDGFISDEAVREVSGALKIPQAELFGTVTFYHHFSRTPPGQSVPRVCTGPICCLRGARGMLEAFGNIRAMSRERERVGASWEGGVTCVVPAMLIDDFQVTGGMPAAE